MILGHLPTLALRGLWRHRIVTAINIAALVLGLLGFLFVGSNLVAVRSADSLWPNADRIVRLTQQTTPASSGITSDVETNVSFEVERYLKADLPEIEAVSRMRHMGARTLSQGERHAFAGIEAVDEDFARIFAWPLRQGEWRSALARPGSAVLDPSVAQKLFGDENPLGKTVTLRGIALTVTGVLDSFPEQLSMFDMKNAVLVSRDVGDALDYHKPDQPQGWLEPWTMTFALLPPGWDAAKLDAALAGFGDRHVPRDLGRVRISALPLGRVVETMQNSFLRTRQTGLSFVFLTSALAFLVLIVACLNYANLAAAIAEARLREMAFRKLLGEGFLPIFAQGLLEAGLLSLAALGLLLPILYLIAPLLDGVPGLIDARWLCRLPGFWGLVVLGTVAATLAGGLYPALLQAFVRPSAVLKAGRHGTASNRLSTVLVALQFFAASFLLVAGLVAHGQNAFMRHYYAPQDRDMVFVVQETEGRTFRGMRDSVASIPGIEAFSARATPWPLQGTASIGRTRQGGARIQIFDDGVGPDYFATIGTRVIAGRDFSPDRADDLAPPDDKKSGSVSNVVIDRSLAEQYGWSPAAAIGQTLLEFGPGWIWQMTVIGVVEDRPVATLQGGISHGALYHFDGENVWFPILRISRANAARTAEAALAALDSLAPDRPTRLDSEATIYRDYDTGFSSISLLFDGLAAFTFGIAIIGLIGMAMQAIGRRRHEIGIRKTLGADSWAILRLLLVSFSRPVLIATLASWPIAYAAAQAYLDLFIKRETLSALPFLASLAATLGVAVLAVGTQTLRAARGDPADILRHE